MFKLGTFNIKNSGPLYEDPLDSWENRKESIKTIIQRQNWDVFGLQEVKEDQLKELKKLEKYNFVGEIRDNSDEGEYNPVFYREDKFSCLDNGTFWLSDTPEKMSHAHSWNAACPRIATWAVLRQKNSDKELLFIATHLDFASEFAREKGATLIADFVKERKEKNVAIVGDLNGEPSEVFYKKFSQTLKDTLINSPYHIGPYVTCTGTNEFSNDINWSTMSRIDYIWINPEMKVLKTEIVTDCINGRYPSDHFPVTAWVE